MLYYLPYQVKWRPVLWGMLLNLIFALMILKTATGATVFSGLAEQVTVFLTYTDEGAKFVFGYGTFTQHPFAFKVTNQWCMCTCCTTTAKNIIERFLETIKIAPAISCNYITVSLLVVCISRRLKESVNFNENQSDFIFFSEKVN